CPGSAAAAPQRSLTTRQGGRDLQQRGEIEVVRADEDPCASLLEPDIRMHRIARLGADDLELAALVLVGLPSLVGLDLAGLPGCGFRDQDAPRVFVQEFEDDRLRFGRPRITREVARVHSPLFGERRWQTNWKRDELSSFSG